MEYIGAWIAGLWLAGMVVGSFTLKMRAGMSVWRQPIVFGPDGFGLWWFVQAGFKMVFWPVALAHWLATGRPEPRIVFNHKADARRAAMRET